MLATGGTACRGSTVLNDNPSTLATVEAEPWGPDTVYTWVAATFVVAFVGVRVLKPRDRRYVVVPAARPVTLVPFTTRTWTVDEPGTMVGTVVVVVLGVVLGGVVVLELDAAAVVTPRGARVPEGINNTPMTTATATTPTPRASPKGEVIRLGRGRHHHSGRLPRRPEGRGRRRGRSSARMVGSGGRLEPAAALVEPAAPQTAHHQRRVVEGFSGVDELRQSAVVAGRRHSQADADARGFRSGPGPPRFLEVEDLAVLVCQSHREVKPANAPRAKQGSSDPRPGLPEQGRERR